MEIPDSNNQTNISNTNNHYQIVKIPEYCIKSELILPQYEKLSEELICSICLDIVNNPITCGKCSSPFGLKCIEDWFTRDKRCPKQCEFERSEFSLLLKRLVNKFEFYCFYKTNGCNKIIEYENFNKHVNSCEFANYKCTIPGCNEIGPKNYIIEHLTLKKCEHELETCNNCKLVMKRKDFHHHKENLKYCLDECQRQIYNLQEENNQIKKRNYELEYNVHHSKRQNNQLKKLLKENNIETKLVDIHYPRSKSLEKLTKKKSIHILSDNYNINTDRKLISFLQNTNQCSHELKLEEYSKNKNLSCVSCLKDHIRVTWGCRICNFDVCLICFDKEHKNESISCLKGHFIKPKIFNESKLFSLSCNYCNSEIKNENCYECEECKYYLCINCFKQKYSSVVQCSPF